MSSDIYIEDCDDDTDAWLIEAGRSIDEPEGDVRRLVTSISAGLGRVRRAARILDTDDDAVAVSDRIVKQLIAIGVRRSVQRLVVFASIDGDGRTVDGVRIGLIARYGDDLATLSDSIRDVVDDVLIDTIGSESSTTARRNITVRWQDVYTREWLT